MGILETRSSNYLEVLAGMIPVGCVVAVYLGLSTCRVCDTVDPFDFQGVLAVQAVMERVFSGPWPWMPHAGCLESRGLAERPRLSGFGHGLLAHGQGAQSTMGPASCGRGGLF